MMAYPITISRTSSGWPGYDNFVGSLISRLFELKFTSFNTDIYPALHPQELFVLENIQITQSCN